MNAPVPSNPVPLNTENIAAWSAVSDEQIAASDPEGDFFKKHLLNAAVLGLLGEVAGRRVLDAGAGQGYFSRLLARRGADVTSLEPAARLIEHSRRVEAREPLGIRYVQADLTAGDLDLDAGPGFDAVVANMVFVSIHAWDPALATCVGALRPGGTLVFAVDHPCFETGETSGHGPDQHLVVRDYLTERPLERPVATDFHRTLGSYLNTVVRAGVAVQEVVEPALSSAAAALPEAPAHADLLTHVPNFLIIKCVKPA